jgi:peptide/nickel transport system substrate-binding protein
VQSAARARILSSPSLKANADDPVTGFMWFEYINTKVPPLNNVHCRRAIEYGANKTTLQNAYGGPYGGAIASTAIPPNIVGYQKFDLYNALSKPGGDIANAKKELAACGQPNGFTTSMAYRSDRPRETQAAQALQASLAPIGIKVQLKGYPSGNYFSNFAGVPTFVHSHDIGIADGGWGADWPDAWGYLYSLVAGKSIVPAGNTNIGELNDPVVNNALDKMQAPGVSQSEKNSLTQQVNMQVMKDAVMLPAVYSKALLYRPTDLTNVMVQPYYGQYDYATLGMK